MRASQKSNRTRGRGNRKPSGNNLNRVYESSGPEGKVRGTPQQIIEKYLSLARDAQTSGNRVVAENFLQHAEHYQRILVEAMGARQEQRRDNEQPGMEQPDAEQRETAEAGTGAETADGSGTQPAEGARQGEGRRQSRENGRDNGRRADHDPRDTEVSGLTMIDSGGNDSGSLLVDAEELGASQPRRPRRRREAEPKAEAETAPAAAPAETDAQPE
jgi:hypothetical protein